MSLPEFDKTAGAVETPLATGKGSPMFEILDLTDENLASLTLQRRLVEQYVDLKKPNWLCKMPGLRAVALRNDTAPQKLVEDHQFHRHGITLLEDWHSRRGKGDASGDLGPLFRDGEAIHEKAVKDVHARSKDIRKGAASFSASRRAPPYPGHRGAYAQVGIDTDRSVVLEIGFYGKPVSHAYKYLSESQLNRLRTGRILASTTEFNKDFPFLILDDIVNSCDVEKRTR